MPADPPSTTQSELDEPVFTPRLVRHFEAGLLRINLSGKRHLCSGGQGSIYTTYAYYPVDGDSALIPRTQRVEIVLKKVSGKHDETFSTHAALTQSLASTRQFNILKLIGVVRDEDDSYAVLPYCETFLHQNISKFHELLARDPIAHAVMTVSMLSHVLNALTYMHARKFIHRDVKPANIAFCAKYGIFALADIDSTRSTDAEPDETLHGTLEFMHPTLIASSLSVTQLHHGGDIYGLGKTALFLIDPDAFSVSEADKRRFHGQIFPYMNHLVAHGIPPIARPTVLVVPELRRIEDVQTHLRELISWMMNSHIDSIPSASELKSHCDKFLSGIVSLDRVLHTHLEPLERRNACFVTELLAPAPAAAPKTPAAAAAAAGLAAAAGDDASLHSHPGNPVDKTVSSAQVTLRSHAAGAAARSAMGSPTVASSPRDFVDVYGPGAAHFLLFRPKASSDALDGCSVRLGAAASA